MAETKTIALITAFFSSPSTRIKAESFACRKNPLFKKFIPSSGEIQQVVCELQQSSAKDAVVVERYKLPCVGQPYSSERSAQSGYPSHRRRASMHEPSEQANSASPHTGGPTAAQHTGQQARTHTARTPHYNPHSTPGMESLCLNTQGGREQQLTDGGFERRFNSATHPPTCWRSPQTNPTPPVINPHNDPLVCHPPGPPVTRPGRTPTHPSSPPRMDFENEVVRERIF